MSKADSIAFVMFVLAGSTAAYAQAQVRAENLEVSKMTRAEIKAHNEGRDKLDPNYIVCKTHKVTGSLAKRESTCHTVAQWEVISDRGKDYLGTIQERSRTCTSPDACIGG